MFNSFIFTLYLLLIQFLRGIDNYPTIHGRYTRDIDDYRLVIPHKLTQNGKFLSFSLPNYFPHDNQNRRKRSADDGVNYGIWLHGVYHHLELWPNYDLLSPSAVVEKRDPTISVAKRQVRSLSGQKVCHYLGKIRGKANSRVAISTCDGLAGYILVDNEKYFVEPLMEHGANSKGHHLHMIYKKSVEYPGKACGTSCDWEGEWKSRLKEHYLKSGGFKDTKRTLESKQRYLEILVVCDKKFIKFHRKIDVQTYVMTIMNMVYDNYHDASSGNQIDIAVVRIIYLEKEEEEIDLMLTPEAHKTLRSFCDWQATVNPKDVKNPIHHDIAVLMTRHDLCDEEISNCDLMGLAYVGVPCTEKDPCAINEDNGLVLAVVVTHEVGHIMGCAHDAPDDSGCQPTYKDGSYNVMAPAVHMNTRQWSTCSRTYMTALLDNDLGECLDDEPDESNFKFAHLLPGVVYDYTYQCDWFMKGSELCGPPDTGICKVIMCTLDRKKCSGCGEPAADGTTCGENKWCFKSKCVEKGKRPEAINGGWGDWGGWTECSRTCGIGVSYQERPCDNPQPQYGGRYCLGERKNAKLCNTEPCPEGSSSFRAVQCAEKNNQPLEGFLHKWKPYLIEDKPCELFCINEENTFSRLEPRVKDGTKCKRGAKDLCISGVCTKIGCDMKIKSEAVDDICGVCEGDGTTCKIVDEVYRGKGSDYTKVTVISKGVVNLEIEELAPSINTIAITDESGQFYLNAGHRENPDNSYDFGGIEGVYSHPQPTMEKLSIYGPLKKSLVLNVCFYNPRENVGYHYRYADPSQPNPDYKPKYHWEIVKWEDCTARCGGGTELGEPSCIEEKMGKVSPKLCQGLEKPGPQTRVCNELPCVVKWRVGKWGKCVACKNQSGVRVREVECVRESSVPNGDDVLLEDDQCTPPKPPSRELCDSGRVCVKKRFESDLPMDMMRDLWYQTVVDMINIDPMIREDVVMNSKTLRKIHRDLKRHMRTRSIHDMCATYLSPSPTANTTLKPSVLEPKAEKKVVVPGAKPVAQADKDKTGALKVSSNKSQPWKEKSPVKIGETKKPEQAQTSDKKDDVKAKTGANQKQAQTSDQKSDVKVKVNNGVNQKDFKSEQALKGDRKDKVKAKVKEDRTKSKDFKSEQGQKLDQKSSVKANEGKPQKSHKGGGKKSELKVKIGSIVEDRVDPNDFKVIEVNIQAGPPANLSDEAFVRMGDKISDTLDFKHKKVITGKAAAQKLKEFHNDTGG